MMEWDFSKPLQKHRSCATQVLISSQLLLRHPPSHLPSRFSTALNTFKKSLIQGAVDTEKSFYHPMNSKIIYRR
jgi:hypothetical protein